MKATFKNITIDINTKNIKHPTTWEQSRAFRKIWKELWFPMASFKSDSFSMGDSLRVDLQEKIDDKTRALIEELRNFFESWSYNAMEDIHYYKQNNSNPFSFKYVFIYELRE